MFAFHLPNIYIPLALRNLHFSSTFSLPQQTILNKNWGHYSPPRPPRPVNDSTKPKRSLPFKLTNGAENTQSLKPKNSLNGAFLQQKQFHQFSTMSRAGGHRIETIGANCIRRCADCWGSAETRRGNNRKSQKARSLSLSCFFFFLEFYEQDVDRDNSLMTAAIRVWKSGVTGEVTVILLHLNTRHQRQLKCVTVTVATQSQASLLSTRQAKAEFHPHPQQSWSASVKHRFYLEIKWI